jgi:lipoprotein-anchoring transpeptidase ErfK/SrfK
MRQLWGAAGALAAGVALIAQGACSPGQTPAPAASAAKPAQPAKTAAAPAPAALSAQAIDAAVPAATPPPQSTPTLSTTPDPALIRAEVLLDRAGDSPGVIDGRLGENERHAVAAFQARAGLPTTGDLDPATWSALSQNAAPVMQAYTITPADTAGPFAPDVGEDFVKLAALPAGPLYSSPQEALAERFHMSQALIAALNPAADFAEPGTALIVAAPGAAPLAKGDVTRIEVSKANAQVTAYGASGAVLAVYPATVGSTERPSPSGTHKVNGVAWNPDYVYDPKKLHWGPRSHGKLRIQPGPNGPVGVVWIDLNAPDYGIHGSPDPDTIGKTASHGCVRLTNWDAVALAHGVKPGVPVTFVGARQRS